MLLLVFYNCICSFLCQCLGFNPSLCCFSPFLLSYVTVSRPCCLLESIPTEPQCMHVSYLQLFIWMVLSGGYIQGCALRKTEGSPVL